MSNETKTSQSDNYDNHVFQILTVNEKLIEKNKDEGIDIVIGKLEDFREHYKDYKIVDPDTNKSVLLNTNFDFFNNYLPSPGVEVNERFIQYASEDKNDLKYAEFSTVRFLLQCRRLSQMMTKTWLYHVEDDDIKDKPMIKYMKRIFDLFNYQPENYYVLSRNEKTGLVKKKQTSQLDNLSSLLLNDPENGTNVECTPEASEPSKDDDNLDYSYFIRNQNALILALFFSGQAIIEDEKEKTLQRLHEPVLSTYELIWEYELDLNWDSYYATRRDIARPGYRKIKHRPIAQLTLGLPARPDRNLLKDEQIKKWVYAKEQSENPDDLPFYPKEQTAAWRNKEVMNVFPPDPYIILSTT
ncbi:MAG: hypothetical protein F6K23_02950 [Okeania sp. SIO2C9]|uniref:hypothetical protein n=1 Tax=Okeania sp. SIO2C9 TaxID=2607791 RepID=UPI0013C1B074|nr:hypothetical protein [Okeania sp. SIO2C9]NEQ72121.1 hypothetical protein [Okeania sp. SIO2C9]